MEQAGYSLIGGHRTVAKELNECVVCKKLRGPLLDQRMADLPADRTEVAQQQQQQQLYFFTPKYTRKKNL